MAEIKDAKARLQQKLRDCYDDYYASWLKRSPAELIEQAEEISSVQRMRDELPGAVTEEDAEYLLRFRNPLEVVADRWQSMNGSGSVVDEDMTYILWELRDRQDAESDYEMEPEFYGGDAPTLSM